MPLTSFVHDHLERLGMSHDYVDNRPRTVRCVHPVNVEQAYAKIEPMFWGPRIPLDEACATIRAWIDTLYG